MTKMDLYRMANEIAARENSRYRDICRDRTKLFEFMASNEWFDLLDIMPDDADAVISKRKQVVFDDRACSRLESVLTVWMRAYLQGNEYKLKVLEDVGMERLPGFTAAYCKYVRQTGMAGEKTAWILLDFLLAELDAELEVTSDERIEQIVEEMDYAVPLTCARYFSRFMESEYSGCNGRWVYKFGSRTKKADNEAYSVNDFCAMAFCVFNEQHWQQNELIRKACGSQKMANLWAFIAMHFVCGLRAGDIERLPRFELPCNGDETRKKFMEGTFGSAAPLVKEMEIRLRLKAYKPRKTAIYSDITDVKLFIPTSLTEPMGIILGIAASYHTEDRPGLGFIKRVCGVSEIESFFGSRFLDFTNGKTFSSRRANKAYLQALSSTDGADSPKGYMLAALARNHKGSIASLPKTTEIYLRDAKFSGYSPEFIAKEMFERGVLGFVPYLLLKMLKGEAYSELPIHEQTLLIKELGLSPLVIERIVESHRKSMAAAHQIVKDLFTDNVGAEKALQKIASGTAVGKQEGFLCVLTAADMTCKCPERENCIGCRYEIYTQSVVHLLTREYSRMNGMKNNSPDGWKYKALLLERIMPKLTEIVESVVRLYPEGGTDFIDEILNGGLKGYVGCG